MNIDNMDLSLELSEKAMACKTPEELLALAKAEGYKLPRKSLRPCRAAGRGRAPASTMRRISRGKLQNA